MPLFNTSLGGSTPKTLVTPDGVTDSIAIEKVDGKTVKPSSTLGNAIADKVLQGYTFTSDGGFDIAGTSTAAIDLEAAQSEIAEASESIKNLTNEVQNGYNPTNIIESKTSVSNGKTSTVLNVSGSGELHLYHLYIGTYSYFTGRATAQIIIDDSFTMYIPMGNNEKDYSSIAGWRGHGLFLTFDYLIGCNTYYSSGGTSYVSVSYKIIDDTTTTVYLPYYRYNANGKDVVYGESGTSNAGILGTMCDFPCDNTTNSDTNYCFLGSPKPLAFNKSLKILVTNNYGSAINSSVYYKLT